MIIRNKQGALQDDEKSIVKALLNKNWRNQDIQAILNIGRKVTINSGRITEVKQDTTITPASDKQVEFFKIRKNSYDQKTGLNFFDDERLIRAREAMILAVQIFNSTALQFKSEVFSILTNVAWTYLLHEYYERRKINIINQDGKSLLLSQMLKRDDCPLSKGIINNLNSLKTIRDEVEHKLLGRADSHWLSLFQACCLNFDKVICDLFSERLTLTNDLSFALQFAKLNIEQISIFNQYEVPPHINAIDALLIENMNEENLNDLEYQFKVIYTLTSASNSKKNFQFIKPDTEEGKEIHNVLLKHQSSDKIYPYKPNKVVDLVHQKTNKKFNIHDHTKAWKKHQIRPLSQSNKPENTNRKYCIYHQAHNDYTYSEEWVELLISELSQI